MLFRVLITIVFSILNIFDNSYYRQMTDKRQMTTDNRQTTNDKRQTTNDKQQTTNENK